MPDDITPNGPGDTGAPAAPAAAPAAAAPPAAPPAEPAAPADPPADQWDHERGMATIHKLREELKEARKTGSRVGELEQKLREYEDANKTELERAQQRAAELEQEKTTWQREKRATDLKLAVYGRQTSLGIADADLAIAALDQSQVEWGEDGQPSNLDELLTDLLDRKPLLKTGSVGTKPPPSSDGGAGSGTQPPPSLTAEEVEFANQQGIPLDRYARMKAVGSIDDWREATRT